LHSLSHTRILPTWIRIVGGVGLHSTHGGEGSSVGGGEWEAMLEALMSATFVKAAAVA
jgi:hypothetical protein